MYEYFKLPLFFTLTVQRLLKVTNVGKITKSMFVKILSVYYNYGKLMFCRGCGEKKSHILGDGDACAGIFAYLLDRLAFSSNDSSTVPVVDQNT